MRIYRPSERHEFDLGSGTFDGEEAIPGTVECLDCTDRIHAELRARGISPGARFSIPMRAAGSTGAG